MAEALLIDSTVLIDEHRGDARARTYLEPLLVGGAGLIHPVSAGEVLGGAKDRTELAALDQLVARFRLAHAKHVDFTAALGFVRQFTLSHRIGWPDCLIAATGIRLGLPVVTVNDKHFRVIRGLSVIRPY